MSCLSDRKPNRPFVINLFCASYNSAPLGNGISLKVTDTQREAAALPAPRASLLLPPPCASLLYFTDSFLLFPEPVFAAFWLPPVRLVLLCDSANRSPALPRGKRFPDILRTHPHCFPSCLPVGSCLVQEFGCAVLPLPSYRL